MTTAAVRASKFDLSTQGKIASFSLARLLLMTVVLLSTIFLRQEVLGESVILQIYAVLLVSFFISLVNVTFWDETLKVRFFIPSQLLYDLLLTSYLVYLTGVNDSIFLFLYLLNIVFASVVYQLNGALLVATISGSVYAFIYYANVDSDLANTFYNLAYNELFFLLTALLCGQLMDELKRQKLLLETQRADIARLELLNDRLLNSIPLGIVTVDGEEYVQNVNRTALSFLRLEHPPAMRIKYYELFPELRGIIAAWPQMTETQRLRFLFRHGNDAQARFSFNLVQLKRPEEGGAQQFHHILMFQDVSPMLELERKLELESRLAATGELAAGIAHEIRNPLASISGSIEMLAQNIVIENPSDQRLLDIALREIKRLNHLITDFLEYAKPKDERGDNFLLLDMVREVGEAAQTGAQGPHRPELSLELDPTLAVHANRERMKQVFFNLFLNSVEAAARPVKISVRAAAGNDGFVTIDVADDGPGVPADLAAKIFAPFFTTKSEGTGLGLATVARILKAAKGEIQLVPSGSGALFRLRIPTAMPFGITGNAS